MLYLLVSIGFQILFHSPPGVLFTFPSRYLFTIGLSGIFSLTGWAPLIHSGFHVSRATQVSNSYIATLSSTRLSRSPAVLSNTILLKSLYNLLSDPITPTLPKQSRFGLLPVRSPLLRESLLFSFPMGTKMFQFPTFPSFTLLYSCDDNLAFT